MISFGRLTQEEARAYFSDYAPLIQQALEHTRGECDILDVEQEVYSGHVQIWTVVDLTSGVLAVMTTKVQEYERKRALQIMHCAGYAMENWLPNVLLQFEEFADEHHCHFIELVGRRGWEQILKPYGYSHTYSTVTKPLDLVRH